MVAGNYQQFMHFVHFLNVNPRDYQYVPDEDHMRGYHDVNIVLTGTWWQNPAHKMLMDKEWCRVHQYHTSVMEIG